MRPQILMTAFGIFIMGVVFACISSGRWLLGGEMDIINALASFNIMSIQVGGAWGLPAGIVKFYSAISTAFLWDYPYLASGWAIFIKIPLWLVSITVIWGLIELSVNLVQGIVQGVLGTLRSLGL